MLGRCMFAMKRTMLPLRIYSKIPKRNVNISFFEPPYLESMKPKLPIYEAITVQIKGYDFTVLESFQKFAHSIADYLNMNVDICWAHPAKHFTITKLKPRLNIVETSFKLRIYERNIKIINVSAAKIPLLVELLQGGLPAGTTLSVFQFDPEHYKERYVPDHDLLAKRKELDELGGPPIEENENPFFQAPQ